MGWADAWTGEDWQSAAFLNMFTQAITERSDVAGTGLPAATISVGDDIQGSGLYGGWQASLEAIIDDKMWCKVDDIEGDTAAPEWWDDHEEILGHDWTRKYPREFASSISTAYVDGGGFTNGDFARRLDNGLVYKRVAGAWVVQAPGTDPDVVTAFGNMQAGDYIGVWIFDELRTVINALNVIIWEDFTGDATPDNETQGSSTPVDNSANDAFDDAEANPTFADSTADGSSTYTILVGSGGTYLASYFMTRFFDAADNMETSLNKTVRYYVATEIDGDEYADHGSGLTAQGEYIKYGENAAGASATDAGATLGSNTVADLDRPTVPGVPGSGTAQNTAGWKISDDFGGFGRVVLVDFDFTQE